MNDSLIGLIGVVISLVGLIVTVVSLLYTVYLQWPQLVDRFENSEASQYGCYGTSLGCIFLLALMSIVPLAGIIVALKRYGFFDGLGRPGVLFFVCSIMGIGGIIMMVIGVLSNYENDKRLLSGKTIWNGFVLLGLSAGFYEFFAGGEDGMGAGMDEGITIIEDIFRQLF